MSKYIRRLNKPLFNEPESHPARRFLEAFIECRESCVGQELPEPFGKGVDQRWWSTRDCRQYSFSGFAYSYLSFDVKLDGWLSNAPFHTESENKMLSSIEHMKDMMTECREAAVQDGNHSIVRMTAVVMKMLDLWNDCIEQRIPRNEEDNE